MYGEAIVCIYPNNSWIGSRFQGLQTYWTEYMKIITIV